jgi:hypothetical protein
MGKPTPSSGRKKFTQDQVKTLLNLAKNDPELWKDIVRKRRHSIAHALMENPNFIAEAKKKGIDITK